jgi:hypothetical protein
VASRGSEQSRHQRPGSVTPTPSIILFASKPRGVFFLPPPFDPGFGIRLSSSSFRMVGDSEVECDDRHIEKR